MSEWRERDRVERERMNVKSDPRDECSAEPVGCLAWGLQKSVHFRLVAEGQEHKAPVVLGL